MDSICVNTRGMLKILFDAGIDDDATWRKAINEISQPTQGYYSVMEVHDWVKKNLK